jgi:hypothetical protein
MCMRYALCIQKTLSLTAGIRAFTFNSCNDATVRTQEVPLVYAPCYIIALLRMRSRFAQYKVCYLWDEWETYFVDELLRSMYMVYQLLA